MQTASRCSVIAASTVPPRQCTCFFTSASPSPVLHSYPSLQEHAQTLSEQLDAFDWDQIPETSANFPTILQLLEAEILAHQADVHQADIDE